jgi:RNA polymerase sigma factor (sigma-70 family)
LPRKRSEAAAMPDAPPLDDLLRNVFAKVDSDDVRLFYDYFEELKGHVRKCLSGKARLVPGESHIAHSALFSLFCDAALHQVPLQDVDEHGYPMLWPLLLKYLERHCEKWKKYYRAKKRAGTEIPLAASDPDRCGIDPPDHRGPADDERAVGDALAALYEKLTPRQRRVADLSAQGCTLEEIADEIGCSESLVSLEKKAIRKLLETF